MGNERVVDELVHSHLHPANPVVRSPPVCDSATIIIMPSKCKRLC